MIEDKDFKLIELEHKKTIALAEIQKEFNNNCCPNYHSEEFVKMANNQVYSQYEIEKKNIETLKTNIL